MIISKNNYYSDYSYSYHYHYYYYSYHPNNNFPDNYFPNNNYYYPDNKSSDN